VAPGKAGQAVGRTTVFRCFFSHRFFEGFLKVLASILDDFFDDFGMFFV